MATTEQIGLLTHIDEQGNLHLLYPVTNMEAVVDLVEALAGKAPAGYGLGSELVYLADLNTALDTGTFWANSETAHIPDGFDYASVRVQKRSSVQSVQRIRALNAGWELIRTTIDGGKTWVEEWENPPLLLGEEYRTTERCDGKVVYAKRTDCAGASNNKRITYDWGATAIIRSCGTIAGRDMPYIYIAPDNANSAWYTAHATAITIWCGSERVDEQVYVTLWYTKD